MVHRRVWGAATAAGALPALALERQLVRRPLCAASRAARAVHAQHHPRSRLHLIQLLRLRATRTARQGRRFPSRARCRTRRRATRAARPLRIAYPRRLHGLRPKASRRGRAGARVPLLCTAAQPCECSSMQALTTAPRPSPQVRDAGGQRLRLVHSLAPRARAQFGAVWYHRKLPVRRGFEVRFTVQFQRPSTCAMLPGPGP